MGKEAHSRVYSLSKGLGTQTWDTHHEESREKLARADWEGTRI